MRSIVGEIKVETKGDLYIGMGDTGDPWLKGRPIWSGFWLNKKNLRCKLWLDLNRNLWRNFPGVIREHLEDIIS